MTSAIASRIIGIAMLLILALTETQATLAQQQRQSLDFARIGDVLVEHLDLQAGERVLLVAAPGRFDPLMPLLRQRTEAAGAEFLGTWSVSAPAPESWSTAFTDQISKAPQAELPRILARVDASIMIAGRQCLACCLQRGSGGFAA